MRRWQGGERAMTGQIPRRAYLAPAAAMFLLAAAGVPAQAASAAAERQCERADAADPLSLYGEEIRFDVRRNGTPVGSHTVSFTREGGKIATATRFEVAVDVLIFTAYRYVYASQGTWSGGCLVGLTAAVDDNGKESAVRVRQDGGVLSVAGPLGEAVADRRTLPTEHWDYAVVGAAAVINTITGRVNRVNIAAAGTETVQTADGRALTARRYVYRGELDNEVWYDAKGRWVKMRFPGADGSTIEYVCVKCGLDGPASHS